MKIEIRHLKYVVMAAERGSFRSAAKALQIQESSISRRIRDLEDDIGTALFIRNHSGVELTNAGRRFVERARGALTQVSDAAIDAASFGRGESGAVRIGIFSSLASGFLADLIRSFIKANPTLRTEMIEGGPAEHISEIRRHRLDVAFVTGEPEAEGCDRLHLWDERVLVALPSAHPLVHGRAILWSDLCGMQFIVSESNPGPEFYDYLVKHLADLGRHPNVERHSVGRDNLMNLVAMGQGLTLTSEAATGAVFPGVEYRELDGEVLPFSAIWSPRNDNPALRKLLSLARLMSRRSSASVAKTTGTVAV